MHPSVYPCYMYHVIHGATRFDNEADFQAVDDGKWVDTPAKYGEEPAPAPAEIPAPDAPAPAEDIEALIERAKELGIRGNVRGMKRDTLVAKIIEAEEAE